MKLANKIYIISLILVSFIALESFYGYYIQKNNAHFYKGNITSEEYAESKEYSSEDYQFVSDCDTLENAISTVGYTPIKEYGYDDNTYFFVSEGLELADTRVVLYVLNSKEKNYIKLQKIIIQ